jgi:NAD(P)-dependent dehydrogenase (short-subunit alcohol dehydrogenase family)
MDARGRWDAEDIPDQSGRTVLVTGANSGLGLATATQLARFGAKVTLACRNTTKAQDAAAEIRLRAPRSTLEVLELDVSDLSSVRDASARFLDSHERLDLLVNNAGVMGLAHQESPDGFELQLATNHLGHFALTGLLLGSLEASAGSRVVTVSSLVHRMGRIDFADLQHRRHYGPWSAYAQSKLANLLFTYELDRRLRASGSKTLALAAHPGFARTNLQSGGAGRPGAGFATAIFDLGGRVIGQSAAEGALPILYAASAPGVVGGTFYGPGGFLEQHGPPVEVQSSTRSHDPRVARRLWEISEELTGVHFSLEQS